MNMQVALNGHLESYVGYFTNKLKLKCDDNGYYIRGIFGIYIKQPLEGRFFKYVRQHCTLKNLNT